MNTERTVQRIILIDAPPQRVWEVITNPEYTKKYFFGTEVESDWKPGSPIRFKGDANGDITGKIKEVIPAKKLVYSVDIRGTNEYTNVSIILLDEEGKTEVTVTDGDFARITNGEEKYKMSDAGWTKILLGMKKTAEEIA